MTEANDRFRAARERTASLARPSEGLSRQELAEVVSAWIWEHHHEVVTLDAHYLGKIERGLIRCPRARYREAFRAILGAATDSALGFVNPRALVKPDDVDHKRFVPTPAPLGAATLTRGPVIALLESSEPIPVPPRVGATEIEQIRTAARVFTGWESTYGGAFARDAALTQLRWSAGLLEAICPDQLRPELFSAIGDLAETTGTMAFDAGAHEDARRVFTFALGCAEQGKDWHLRATVLSTMAVQAIRTGRPDEGVTLSEYALVRADDRLTATERAMLHTNRARAFAKMRRVEEALTAIGTADEHFAHSTPADDPPFMAFWNAAMHAGNTGQALADLAMLGHHPEQATDRLTTAVTGNVSVRARALCLTKLASLTMTTGDLSQAAARGREALATASTLRSRRVTEELRELYQHATEHRNIEEVAHLRHQIGILIVTS